jgi:tRNA A-37 threonylcarbamoyl transferase component Bud32
MMYSDKQKIGEGAFADVYLCERDGEEKQYAKKILRASHDQEGIDRFKREVHILSRLNHPNIVKVVDSNLDAEPYWYVMPYYKSSLRKDLLAIKGDEARIRHIFSAVLEAVEYAHDQGILHRDLKVSNILLNDDDVAVSDFGLGRIVDAESTRMTKTGDYLGTFLYMAPEQMGDAKNADQRSEVYSLGRILYSLYTGPLQGVIQDTSRIDPGAAIIIDRCTLFDPDRRYQSVGELKEAWSRMFEQNPKEAETDELKTLVASMSWPQDITAADFERLIQLMRKYADDTAVMHEVVMKMSGPLAQAIYGVNRDFLRRVINDFVEHANEQSWGYDYTDGIGKACDTLYMALNDYEVRAALIHCLLEVGYSHNRYYVMGLFKTLIEARKQPGEGLAIYERLKDLNYHRRAQAHDALDLAILDPQIARLFGDEMEAKRIEEEQQRAAIFPFSRG